jgi:hypothetical protein
MKYLRFPVRRTEQMKTCALLTSCLFLALALPVSAQEGGRTAVELVLLPGEASATPIKKGVSDVNGGVIDVAQPNSTTIVVTMSGLTAANADLLCQSAAQYQFDLIQGFEVVFNSKRVKSAKLFVEGQVIGLLRSDHSHHTSCLRIGKKCGLAECSAAVATVGCGSAQVVGVNLPSRATADGEDLSVYTRETAQSGSLTAGHYTLHENWGIGVTHPAFHCRGASAEFAPQPNYAPASYWFSEFRPFNGLATKDFGFRLTLKLIPEFKPLPEDKQ